MPWPVPLLLDERRRVLARLAIAVAVVAGAAVWIVDGLVDSLLLGNRGLTAEIFRPTLSELWMRLLVTALVVVVYLDRRANAKLRLLSSILDEAPDGVQIATLDGRIAYSNRAVETIYGFSHEDLRGKHVNDMNVDPAFAADVVLPALQREGRWVGEIDVKHKDGRTFPIWLATSVAADRRGRPMAAVGIIRDISERKRAEENLKRYATRLEEATRLKDLFADILRHDLLGPAAALRVSIETLLRRDTDPKVTRVLTQARRSCLRIIDMIESAATYAKLSALEQIAFETLELSEVIRGVISDFEPVLAESGTRITFEPGGRYPTRANPIVADVFANLVSNAIKYAPPGDTIAISIDDAGESWVASVADRGAGIRDEDKDRIFTRFERLRKEGVKGSGLGLAIAKRVVDMHHGRIWVDDNPGGGTVFRVALRKA